MRYYPFGETRLITGSVPTDRRYTGQRQESVGLGSLYDYGARFYAPALGRFISADTLVPQLENPQAWNRYAYVVNSPLKYNDPTGHCFFICGLIGGAIGAIAGAVGYTAQVITTGSGWNSDAYWTSVGAGAGTGALIGSTLGVVAPAALEATSVTLAGASAATGSGTLATAATSTYAAAGTVATADVVAFKVVSDRLGQLRQINLAPSSPVPRVPGLGSSTGAMEVSPVDDSEIIVRGGTQPLPPPGTTFSGSRGATLEEAASGVPHGQIRWTTAGGIRSMGGVVDPRPELTRSGVMNWRHVNIVEGEGETTFSPLMPNPVTRDSRIQ